MRHIFCLLVISFVAAWPARGAQRRIEIQTDNKQVGRYQRLEFTLAADVECQNPYDPQEVDFRLELETPSGKRVWIPAFYFQPFEQRPQARGGDRQWLYPTGKAVWKGRFAPTEVGVYKCTAILKDRAGSATSAQITFQCNTSQDKGFIRVSAKDPRYLEFDDGSPFFAIGQNLAFVKNSDNTIAMLRKLGENEGNYARVWACAEDWGMAIEARKSAWGRSWDWNPPIVLAPDREGFHAWDLCLKISGEAGTALTASPSSPVGLRPNTRYRLSGQMRSDKDVELSLEAKDRFTLAGKKKWADFQQEFTTGADQWWLSGPTFRLSAKGTAWLRNLSLTEAGGGPELLEEADIRRPTIGVYNQKDCYMLDQVVAAAEQSGVRLAVVQFTRDHYMAMLTKEPRREYDQATTLAKQLLRYCAARWGYSTHIATWEYFNEMNPGLPTDRFYSELGQELEQVDINRHLRANSTWSSPAKDYKHPKLDVADLHFYLRPANGELWKDEVGSVRSRWEMMSKNVTGRPIFFSEFGITDNNWQRAPELDKDKEFVHHHNALWASAMSGFANTVSHWYWDDIHKKDMYHLYRPIARFAADIPWTTGHLRPASATCDKPVRIIGLAGDKGEYLWINDPLATWWKIAMEGYAPAQIDEAMLTVNDLTAGTYQVQWWDTRQGKIVGREQVLAAAATIKLKVPAFRQGIACKIVKADQ